MNVLGSHWLATRSARRGLMWLAAACTLAISTPVGAQTGSISAERFQPAPGPNNFLTVETARVDGDMAYSFGVLADYAHDPFRVQHCVPGSCSAPGAAVSNVDVIKDLATANLLGSLTPFPRLQIGLRVPIVYASGQGIDLNQSTVGYGEGLPGGVSGVAIGDPTLELKVRALGQVSSPVTAGLSASVSAPVGHAMSPSLYVGDSSPVGVLRAIVDANVGRFFFAANAGGALRGSTQIGSLDLGPELRFGVGAGVRPVTHLSVLAEAFASTNLTTNPGTNVAEADLAVRYALGATPVLLTAGGGVGLNDGVGAPVFRVFAGVGVEVDRKTKVADDLDTDHDGIPNDQDRCPLEGGDVVRLPGPFYGCPKRDSDGDGVPDYLDTCPDKPGVAAAGGCPDPDRDHDGIPNEKDKCPDQPETYNGFQDADGCPDVAPIVVEVRNDQIVVINEKINFDFESRRIVGARSFEALDLVAQAIKARPEIKQIEVAGHTDNVGPHEVNMKYSRQRAEAVVAYLIEKGIARSRLVSNGYGPDKPLTSNDTEEGRAENRRVQFNILLMFK